MRNKFLALVLMLLTGLLWKNIFELLEWSRQYESGRGHQVRRNSQEPVQIYGIESNCGIEYACPADTFPLFLKTGITEEISPELCVSGKHLIKKNSLDLRGLNAVIVEPDRFEIIDVKNFDTHKDDRTQEIRTWLTDMLDDDILVIFTSDDASNKLKPEVRLTLNRLGSGMVQNLRFHTHWYMITQKGRTGYTIYEKMSYSKNKGWGDVIEVRTCVPRMIPKERTILDETLRQNKKRDEFCKGRIDEKYRGFCNEYRFELMIPALLTNKTLIGNPAYGAPIFLYATDDFELFVASLNSVLHQPGVLLPMVTVLHEEHHLDAPELSDIYGMRSLRVKFSKTFDGRLDQARKISARDHPNKPFVIVVDQNVILSPDFLFFMAQMIDVIERDSAVSAVSAWSPNCYAHEGDVHLAYRAEGRPKYGAMVPVARRNETAIDVIAPDVSRVQGPEVCHPPSLEENWIMRPQDLTKERYFHKLVMLQQLGQVVDLRFLLSNCSASALRSSFNTVYFSFDEEMISEIVKCLGVVSDQFGIYEGIIRLSVLRKTVLLISSESSFYRSRPIASV